MEVRGLGGLLLRYPVHVWSVSGLSASDYACVYMCRCILGRYPFCLDRDPVCRHPTIDICMYVHHSLRPWPVSGLSVSDCRYMNVCSSLIASLAGIRPVGIRQYMCSYLPLHPWPVSGLSVSDCACVLIIRCTCACVCSASQATFVVILVARFVYR